MGNPHNNLLLTKRRKEKNTQARQKDEEMIFDLSITSKNDLAECFRVFTDPDRISKNPARRAYTVGLNLHPQLVKIYTDGACLHNGKRNTRCGSGIWFGPNDPQNAAIRVPGHSQSNQVGEIAAVIAAAKAVAPFWPIRIITDSKYVIEGLTTHLETWENDGWIGIKNAVLFKTAATILKQRTATTSFQWVKGHNGDVGNEESDHLAKEGADRDEPDLLELNLPINFDLQGTRLTTLTQAVAYRGINARTKPTPRPTTVKNLQKAREAIQNFSGTDKTHQENLHFTLLCFFMLFCAFGAF